MKTKQSSSQDMLPIQPLQQDDQGRLTGGFTAALSCISSNALSNDESGTNWIQCNTGCTVNNYCKPGTH